MSIYAYLVCPARRLLVTLGKRLSDKNETVIGFGSGQIRASADAELTAIIWKFLADTAGEEIVVKFDDDMEFETIAEYREIDGWNEGDIPVDVFLRDGAPDDPAADTAEDMPGRSSAGWSSPTKADQELDRSAQLGRASSRPSASKDLGRTSMSISAHLVCPARRLSVTLGKRLRDENGKVTGFSLGQKFSSDDAELTAVIWKFLADTAGEQIVVKFSDDMEFETIAEYREIDGRDEGDIPVDVFLRDSAPDDPAAATSEDAPGRSSAG